MFFYIVVKNDFLSSSDRLIDPHICSLSDCRSNSSSKSLAINEYIKMIKNNFFGQIIYLI